jgi:hypothetical protein
VARLIRSKGVGVFFITQTPKDVPNDVLAQLGNRFQHAVRAFTPQDAKNLKATASTFPESEFYDVTKTLTSLGIGEALVSVLSPKGVPTPVTVAQILPPSSLMSPISEGEYAQIIAGSAIASKYRNAVDRESAREILQKRMAQAEAAAPEPEYKPLAPRAPAERRPAARKAKEEKSVFAEVMGSRVAQTAARQAARTITSSVIRGIFGMLKR